MTSHVQERYLVVKKGMRVRVVVKGFDDASQEVEGVEA